MTFVDDAFIDLDDLRRLAEPFFPAGLSLMFAKEPKCVYAVVP